MLAFLFGLPEKEKNHTKKEDSLKTITPALSSQVPLAVPHARSPQTSRPAVGSGRRAVEVVISFGCSKVKDLPRERGTKSQEICLRLALI